jgi:hypothetical protein
MLDSDGAAMKTFIREENQSASPGRRYNASAFIAAAAFVPWQTGFPPGQSARCPSCRPDISGLILFSELYPKCFSTSAGAAAARNASQFYGIFVIHGQLFTRADLPPAPEQ